MHGAYKAVLAFFSLFCAGCALRIDEARVFLPPKPAPGAAAPSGLYGEQELTSAASDPANPLRARVTHGFIEGARGRLAISRLTRLPEGPSRPLIVHCFGNGTTRWTGGLRAARKALPFGDLMLIDYPGYGESDGAPSVAAFDANKDFILRHLRMDANDRTVVYWGHSLGGWICSQLAANDDRAAGLILETSADNVRDVAQAWIPWFAKPFIWPKIAPALLRYDNSNTLEEFQAPILVLGAGRDDTLPVKLHRSLARQLREAERDVDYVEFDRAGHGNASSQPEFTPALSAFFAKVGQRDAVAP